VSTLITKLFKKKNSDEITKEEIMALASLGYKMGSLVSQENEYLSNVLQLREIKTDQILTPRSVIHRLSRDITVSQALEHEKTQQFTRIPVYEGNVDNIIGMVTNRELMMEDRAGKSDMEIFHFVKPINRVSENLPVHQLLDMFIKKREHLFLVDDEYGQVSGIVSLEDAIETMLGREIVDETDTIVDMQKFAKGKYRERLRKEKT